MPRPLRILFLMATLAVLLGACTQGARPLPPRARAGALDLSGWDFARDGLVPLNGEWRFHWLQLLAPGDPGLAPTDTAGGLFSLPRSWNDVPWQGQPLPAEGYATFSLDLRLPATTRIWAIRSRSVNTAWRIWVDGEDLGGAGIVGTTAEAMVPATLPCVLAFQPRGQRVQVVIQVSNFYHRKGGFWWPLVIGPYDHVLAARESGVAVDLFLLGALLIMGIYHVGLFLLRPKDDSPLFFGLFCLLVGTRMLFVNENFHAELFPWLPWAVAKKLEYAVTFLLTPLFFLFLHRLYPREFPTWSVRALLAFNGLLLLAAVLLPAPHFTLTPTLFNLSSIPVFGYTLVSMGRTAYHRREYALPILAGTLVLVLTTVNDMLNDAEVLRTGFFAPLGLFLFILIQSYVLSKRFANAFQLAEVYARTFQKFVPRQFLDRIAKHGIGTIRLGNAEQDEVTVLFSDIRAFTSISEAMTPDGVLEFLNTYLSRMEPPISAQGGFVDKYLGDAIMALFDSGQSPRGAASAIEAALAMQRTLSGLNAERQAKGLPPIVSGIGLHSGPVIIGTIGGTERMDSTAIGDAVNLASRIEGLTKHYKVDILASDLTVEAAGARDRFLLRFVDRVRVLGKTQAVGLWQVLGHRDDPPLTRLRDSLPAFEAALERYFARDFAAAHAAFRALQAELPDDPVVQLHLDRCALFTEQPPAPDWTGVMDMRSK